MTLPFRYHRMCRVNFKFESHEQMLLYSIMRTNNQTFRFPLQNANFQFFNVRVAN